MGHKLWVVNYDKLFKGYRGGCWNWTFYKNFLEKTVWKNMNKRHFVCQIKNLNYQL